MIHITSQHRFGGLGYLACDRCGAKSDRIDFWSVSPLNYATPRGWTDFKPPGSRVTQNICPACSAQGNHAPLKPPDGG